MKKFLTILAALALTLGLAAPATAVETTSNASMFVHNLSQAPVYYNTASGGATIYYKNAGQTHYAPYGNPITYFYVRSGCTMYVTGSGVTAIRSGGTWYSWTASNGVRASGTATVRVYC